MSYCINLGKWNAIFAVPAEIVDKHIKDITEVQIKVLMYLLRNAGQNLSIDKIAIFLGFPEKDIKFALQCLLKKDLITHTYEENLNSKSNDVKIDFSDSVDKKYSKKTVLRYERPNIAYVAQRIQNSDEINFLMQEAQVILGRPLSNGDSSALLMLHDSDGLPIDVILMLLQYSVSAGKSGMKYIQKTGSNWAAEGINNLEKAEKKIINLNKINVLWNRLENIIGIERRSPTASEEEAAVRWFDEWNFSDDLVREAYERCVNANGKYVLKYMDSIIKRWHTQGIFTIEQALEENMKYKKKNSNTKEKNKPSYSIEEYENYNIFDYI